MKTLTCDTCGHEVEDPVAGRNYFQIEDWDLCEPCKEEIEMDLRPTVRAKSPFNYDWYRDLFVKLIANRNSKIKSKARR